jgi:hypothetical protein
MEIFSEEFREELLCNLDSIVIEFNSDTPLKKIIDLKTKMNLALEKEKDIFNSKMKKNKKFKVHDVVYWGRKKRNCYRAT